MTEAALDLEYLCPILLSDGCPSLRQYGKFTHQGESGYEKERYASNMYHDIRLEIFKSAQ